MFLCKCVNLNDSLFIHSMSIFILNSMSGQKFLLRHSHEKKKKTKMSSFKRISKKEKAIRNLLFFNLYIFGKKKKKCVSEPWDSKWQLEFAANGRFNICIREWPKFEGKMNSNEKKKKNFGQATEQQLFVVVLRCCQMQRSMYTQKSRKMSHRKKKKCFVNARKAKKIK